MPLGKYHCDYCDKEFQDTPSARKRHLQGLQHLRAKALWYDSLKLRDPSQAYAEGFGNGVCNRFLQTGICQYGDSCKYFHPKSLRCGNAQDNIQSSTIAGSQLVSSLAGDMVQDSKGMSWGNIPPSLKPHPEGGYPSFPFVDWG
ncbi:zinc finger CCCH domain-containing protein 3 [Quillaja saponaria]|uniref:Zinc finger CCCH domain-containing protein 3 n=1 Tax=Quillaja saponaria TaxID=32244 RepID=A0AAD7Q1U4_QUISA|nr:zinc finger CCCH domain-containing protein 3 [Quillaja saponaria]